jgi:hypothetical protein
MPVGERGSPRRGDHRSERPRASRQPKRPLTIALQRPGRHRAACSAGEWHTQDIALESGGVGSRRSVATLGSRKPKPEGAQERRSMSAGEDRSEERPRTADKVVDQADTTTPSGYCGTLTSYTTALAWRWPRRWSSSERTGVGLALPWRWLPCDHCTTSPALNTALPRIFSGQGLRVAFLPRKASAEPRGLPTVKAAMGVSQTPWNSTSLMENPKRGKVVAVSSAWCGGVGSRRSAATLGSGKPKPEDNQERSRCTAARNEQGSSTSEPALR